ncbi:hypothetical protein [Neptuniibacter sp. QD37_11]|uniref:hypothetical protein n=1 Tax=Neptuniibacter sp. QD37_11 TaxID=3398209 RepID=UPI0039F4FCF3
MQNIRTMTPVYDDVVHISHEKLKMLFDAPKKLADCFYGLLMNLQADQRIQYVKCGDRKIAKAMLELGLIKTTKKGGHFTYIIPKDVAFVKRALKGYLQKN